MGLFKELLHVILSGHPEPRLMSRNPRFSNFGIAMDLRKKWRPKLVAEKKQGWQGPDLVERMVWKKRAFWRIIISNTSKNVKKKTPPACSASVEHSSRPCFLGDKPCKTQLINMYTVYILYMHTWSPEVLGRIEIPDVHCARPEAPFFFGISSLNTFKENHTQKKTQDFPWHTKDQNSHEN